MKKFEKKQVHISENIADFYSAEEIVPSAELFKNIDLMLHELTTKVSSSPLTSRQKKEKEMIARGMEIIKRYEQ